MREHAYLAAMVSFVRQHVAEHFRANRPGPSPSISAKLLDAAFAIAESFAEHLGAASGAFRQGCARLLRSAVRAVELAWNLQVRSGQAQPLGADVVHVREDRGDRADLTRRFRFPGGGVKMLDQHLVQAIVGGKDSHGRRAELSMWPGWTRCHGSLLLDLVIVGRNFSVAAHPYERISSSTALPW
jgi:hypothetical protein